MVKQESPAGEKSKKQDVASEAAPQSEPAPQAGDAPKVEADPLAALTSERDELKDRMLRLAAETENFKKRLERDKAEFLRRANEGMVKDLLPVLDNLERALSHAAEPSGQGTLAEGVSLTVQELMKVLERHGLEKIEALGQPFNPEFHEAMMQQEDPAQDENTVLTELQKGYMFQGRLLRPAMVVVSKRPAPSDDEGTEIKITIN
ncbi:MAG: nucleotide exchange factor GrpE [Desulfarculus sp.]|nr:nucleotide exchange factor GrpE [Desulfarculus sp.]